MALTAEDSLRLNVLLTRKLYAVRINESAMLLYALYDGGEAKIQLHPDCEDRIYLKQVRELLSSFALGSPEGFPVYLQRWSRMGQVKSSDQARMLCLGEPEAVVAVAHSPEVSLEVAQRVWWSMASAEIARQLLAKPNIANSELGRELAMFILEFLPFEEESQQAIESIVLLLNSSILTDEEELALWKRSKRKVTYLIGFLHARSSTLPGEWIDHESYQINLDVSAEHISQNPYIQNLHRVLAAPGQAFLSMFLDALSRFNDQDSIVLLFEALERYFSDLALEARPRHFSEIERHRDQLLIDERQHIQAMNVVYPNSEEKIAALIMLGMIGEPTLVPVLSQSTASGTVLRKQLKGISEQVEMLIRGVLLTG